MTGKDLMKGLNEIDDDLIEEAGREIRTRRWKRYYSYIAGAAACLVLLFGGLRIGNLNSGKTQSAGVLRESAQEKNADILPEEEALDAGIFAETEEAVNADALPEAEEAPGAGIYEEKEKAVNVGVPAETAGAAAGAGMEEALLTSGDAELTRDPFAGLMETDGSFLYRAAEDGIRITDIREGTLGEEILLELPEEARRGRIREISLSGSSLLVTAEIREAGDEPEPEDAIWYYSDAFGKTGVYAYDIEDPLSPELTGQMMQDGSCVMFLRTEKDAYLLTEEDAAGGETGDGKDHSDASSGGEDAGEHGISAGKEPGHFTRIQSFRPESPSEITDSKLIADEYGEFLTGTESLFLVRTRYEGEAETAITRFSLEQGMIRESGGAVLGGEIPTRLAVSESEAGLSLVTSSVVLLDRQMNITGKLDLDLPEEEICSVCFAGDMVYIMEAGEESALTAVDLSDRSHPVQAAEIPVKGRMEYLTRWGEDRILAAGYTDGEDGTEPGICLQMIDISSAGSPELCGEMIIPGDYYSQALSYDCDAVTADPARGVIAFPAVRYGESGSPLHYFLLAYDEERGFTLLADDEDERLTPACCGICAGTSFYLADREFVKEFPLETGEEKGNFLN